MNNELKIPPKKKKKEIHWNEVKFLLHETLPTWPVAAAN